MATALPIYPFPKLPKSYIPCESRSAKGAVKHRKPHHQGQKVKVGATFVSSKLFRIYYIWQRQTIERNKEDHWLWLDYCCCDSEFVGISQLLSQFRTRLSHPWYENLCLALESLFSSASQASRTFRLQYLFLDFSVSCDMGVFGCRHRGFIDSVPPRTFLMQLTALKSTSLLMKAWKFEPDFILRRLQRNSVDEPTVSSQWRFLLRLDCVWE